MNCLFCDSSFIEKNKIIENKYWVSIYDGYPLTKGHTLIIPKRHIKSFFDISSFRMFLALFKMLWRVKKILIDTYHPTGFNIGINDGVDGGQTIPHLHIHLIPRYKNDGGKPCGVRNIFPSSKANYLNK